MHERNGVCHFTAPTEVDGALMARDLLDYLPQHAGDAPQMWPSVAPPEARARSRGALAGAQGLRRAPRRQRRSSTAGG